MYKNNSCKLTIEIDLISYRWFIFEHIPVFYAANNVSMIHWISITKYRQDKINRVISIIQVSALQTNMMSISIRNKKISFAKKNRIGNLILVANILCIPSNHLYVNIWLKWEIQTSTDASQTIFIKIRVEICQFTKIAKTDLDVYLLLRNTSLGVYHSNRTTSTRTIPTEQLPLDNTPTLIFPTGQLLFFIISTSATPIPDHSHTNNSHPIFLSSKKFRWDIRSCLGGIWLSVMGIDRWGICGLGLVRVFTTST